MSTDALKTWDINTPELPSKVEETLACPQFRILLVGNSGVGKSSLVSSVFNIKLEDIDISHSRAGKADITHEYTSLDNQRFILHDSQGFEAGSDDNWDKAETFLRDSTAKDVQDHVHAIWLCILAPREGARLLQAGDEKLLSLAQELHIPIIIVFTKYDLLVNEQYYMGAETVLSETEAARRAEASFNDRIKLLKAQEVAFVKVSTDRDYPKRHDTLEELTNVTRKCLGDTSNVIGTNPSDENRNHKAEQEKADGVSVLWTTAQQISASLKVEASISEGFKEYWRDLGKNAFFQGHTMAQCIFRIHDDILKVWNFGVSQKLLLQEDFFKQMIELVSPLLVGHDDEVQQDDSAQALLSVLSSASTGFAGDPYSLIAFGAAGISVVAIKFFYGKYQTLPLTARYLGAYIVDLTCVLHRLFVETILTDPPRLLSKELISSVVKSYNDENLWLVHNRISAMNFMHNYEKKIRDLIDETISRQQSYNLLLPPGSISNPEGEAKCCCTIA
ncbi:hypothetical protein B0H34DRAFT_810338 [Crassisporium funariophilum]|nr:hypothetical protein B0H34DRAFT_810338 [Crassisporium funariophilum]